MLDYYKILEVDKGASDEDIKRSFRRLARKHHPDVNGGVDDKFKELNEAYAVLSDRENRSRYDRGGLNKPFSLKTKNSTYNIEFFGKAGDLSDIYLGTDIDHTSIALKIARDPRNNDLLENEANVLKEIFPPSQKEEKGYRYLPKYLESLKISESGKHRQANIFKWLANFHTLTKVRSAFDSKLPMEHGVWMFNRILEGLAFVHSDKRVIHGALNPDHVVVYCSKAEKDPYNHGAKLIDWCYSVKVGETIKSISPEWEHFYPPEVLQKKPATAATDIYMAAKCIIYVLGGDPRYDSMPSSIPAYLTRFLRGCVIKNLSARPSNAWKLYQEFKDHMEQHYGPKKYIRFDIPDIQNR